MIMRKNKYILIAILLWFFQTSTCLAQSAILDNFSAFESSGKVYLSWTVAEGSTCNGIQIYHSLDSIDWERIGDIGGICGSSTESVSYSFVHDMPTLNTINIYRLQLGLSGFSNLVSISVLDIKAGGYRIYPNPIVNNSTIYFKNIQKQISKLSIYNLSGSPVSQTTSNTDQFEIGQINLKPGFFFFTITNDDGQLISGKFLVL